MLTVYISYQMHVASVYILSQKTSCQRLSSYQLYSPWNSIFAQKESQYYQGMSHGKGADDNENLWQVRSLLGEWKIGDSYLTFFLLLFFLCFGSQHFPSPSKWAVLCLFSPLHLSLMPTIPQWLCKQPGSPARCVPCCLHWVAGSGEQQPVWQEGEGSPSVWLQRPKLSPMGVFAPKLIMLWKSYPWWGYIKMTVSWWQCGTACGISTPQCLGTRGLSHQHLRWWDLGSSRGTCQAGEST